MTRVAPVLQPFCVALVYVGTAFPRRRGPNQPCSIECALRRQARVIPLD